MLPIIQDFIPQGRGNRPSKQNKMTYITIHNTGNTGKGANAKSHANYLKSDSAVTAQVCWHYTVDDKEACQHLPNNETAWHCGDGTSNPASGNNTSIGIEVCMNQDGDILKATDNATELVAKLCRDYNIPVENVVQHNKWSGKDCPQMIRAGKPYNWATFISKVRKILSNESTKSQENTSQTQEAQNVICQPTATLEQAIKWAKSFGATETFVNLAKKYWDYSEIHGGVNPVLAFCQAGLETGFGKFKGVINESYCNPCGMKITKGGDDFEPNAHEKFQCWEEGVKAHLDHIALYAGATGYPSKSTADPRHFHFLYGTGKTVETLSKGWCPSNPEYANNLKKMMKKVTTMEAKDSNSIETTVENAINDGVITDSPHWLGVLKGTIQANPDYIKIVIDRYHEKLGK